MRRVCDKINQVAGNVVTARAAGIAYEELAAIDMGRTKSLAQVIKLEGDEVALQVFAGSRGVSVEDEVRFLGKPMQVAFSEDMLGRIFDGGGRPRDGGPLLRENLIEVAGPSVNPAKRIIPRRMIRTNIPMIDVFNSLVVSQKLPIFSVSGEPYNQLLARIALQAEVDLIVLGGIGLKYDQFMGFKEVLAEEGALYRSVLFVNTAAEPIVERLMVPDLCLGGGREICPRRQGCPCAIDGYDQLRRCAQGDIHHYGAGPFQPGLSRRSVQPTGGPLREGG